MLWRMAVQVWQQNVVRFSLKISFDSHFRNIIQSTRDIMTTDITLYYLILEIIFLLGKYLILEITTTKSHMKLWLNKTYSWHWLCWTKPIPGIGYVRQNLFLAYVMLDKTTDGT